MTDEAINKVKENSKVQKYIRNLNGKNLQPFELIKLE